MSSMPSPADQKPSTACLCTTLAKSLHGSMSGLAFLLLFFMGFVVVVLFVCLFRVISFLSSAPLSTQYALMNFFVFFFACWYVRACVRACNTTPLRFALFHQNQVGYRSLKHSLSPCLSFFTSRLCACLHTRTIDSMCTVKNRLKMDIVGNGSPDILAHRVSQSVSLDNKKKKKKCTD